MVCKDHGPAAATEPLAAGFFELVAGFSDESPGDPVKVRFWKDEKVPGLLAKLTDALAALPGRNHGIPCPFPLFD